MCVWYSPLRYYCCIYLYTHFIYCVIIGDTLPNDTILLFYYLYLLHYLFTLLLFYRITFTLLLMLLFVWYHYLHWSTLLLFITYYYYLHTLLHTFIYFYIMMFITFTYLFVDTIGDIICCSVVPLLPDDTTLIQFVDALQLLFLRFVIHYYCVGIIYSHLPFSCLFCYLLICCLQFCLGKFTLLMLLLLLRKLFPTTHHYYYWVMMPDFTYEWWVYSTPRILPWCRDIPRYLIIIIVQLITVVITLFVVVNWFYHCCWCYYCCWWCYSLAALFTHIYIVVVVPLPTFIVLYSDDFTFCILYWYSDWYYSYLTCAIREVVMILLPDTLFLSMCNEGKWYSDSDDIDDWCWWYHYSINYYLFWWHYCY